MLEIMLQCNRIITWPQHDDDAGGDDADNPDGGVGQALPRSAGPKH